MAKKTLNKNKSPENLTNNKTTKKYNYTMKTGRPPHFDNPDNLLIAFKEYRDEMIKQDEPLTVSGFCNSVDSYKDMLAEYAKKPEFSVAIKKIYSLIENNIETGILKERYNATAGIFNLKNNFGWKDKQEVDQNNHNFNMEANKNNISELKELIRKARESKDNR